MALSIMPSETEGGLLPTASIFLLTVQENVDE